MRYSETHKSETHDKLLKSAGRMLRAKGPDGFAVAEVMKEAGLTHGGFYAHFKSKDALMTEALAAVFDRAREKYRRAIGDLPPRHALATYIDFYVSVAHRDNAGGGCPLTALNSDIPRQSKRFRAAFDDGVKTMVGSLAERIAATGIEGDCEALAASVVSAMAGAVAVSRAVSDKALSDEMLETARASIKLRLGLTDRELSKESV